MLLNCRNFYFSLITYFKKPPYWFRGVKLASYSWLTELYIMVIITLYWHIFKHNYTHFKCGILQSRGSTVAGTSASLPLLFPTFWHCLYCIDPLLSFFSCSSLEEVASLIWGDDLKEVAVNIMLFGWNKGKTGKRSYKGWVEELSY